MVLNPKIDLGCVKWCQYAEQCLGIVKKSGYKADGPKRSK